MSRTQRGSVSRRALLGLVSSAAVCLSGCFGDDGDETPTSDDGGQPTVTSTPTRRSTSTPTPAPTPTPTPDADHTVALRDSPDFQPRGTSIRPGETVAWVNEGTVTHTVTARGDSVPDDAAYFASGGFDSETAAVDGWEDDTAGGVAPGESYRHTFETRGLYTYYSIPYEAEVFGQIEVGNPPDGGN